MSRVVENSGIFAFLLRGWRPLPKEFYEIDPRHTPQQVICTVEDLYRRLYAQELSIQWKDYMNNWRPTKFDDLVAYTTEHIVTSYGNLKKMEAARQITEITFSLYQPIHVRLASFRYMTDLAITTATNLGDGQVSFDSQSRQWTFTQRKGAYTNTSHFLARQHK